MAEPALSTVFAFDTVPLNLERTRVLAMVGVLEIPADLEEIPMLSDTLASVVGEVVSPIRAFRVSGRGLQCNGLQHGDCLLVQFEGALRPRDLIVVEHEGVLSARRVVTLEGSIPSCDPPLPVRPGGPEPRVVGSFVGILRKRLTMGRDGRAPSRNTRKSFGEGSLALRPAGRVRFLCGQLGMVESTCAGTRNPRLRRALRNEAAMLRRQLQNEAGHD